MPKWAFYEWKSPFEYHSEKKRKDDPPHHIKVVKGSTHMAVSRGFVNFALNDQRARDWFKWCSNVKFPDEHCFATLNHNPHLGVPGAFIGKYRIKIKELI